ncbi:hypothetical protein SBP28_004276 [Candidozyma auris]
MTVTSLSQEEKDALIYDAREGDLDYLKEVFSSIVPGSLLPTIQDENTLSTPIHMAAANGHVEVVKYLLSLLPKDEAEKLASRQNESGNTALHWAAYNGHLEVCQLLTQEYNVDVYIKNGSGHDAIYEAEANNQEEVENWLLKMFAIEDNVKVEEKGEDTKVTYTPGKESKELEEQAQEAVKKASEEKQQVEAVNSVTASFDDLGLKKKKKKSIKASTASDFEQALEKAGLDDVSGTAASQDDKQLPVQTTLGLPYDFLLSRFFTILKEKNPELAGDRSGPKFRIPPPVCQREGSKKTLFANVQEIATVLQRNPEHLIQFLFAELGTSGSIDGEKRLVLKGKFQPKQMESVLRRYIIEYVTCKTCKSMNTELKRESANRLHFLSCKACGSTRSVSSIKTGFQAQIGRRKRM